MATKAQEELRRRHVLKLVERVEDILGEDRLMLDEGNGAKEEEELRDLCQSIRLMDRGGLL